jgi:hypothetical protein
MFWQTILAYQNILLKEQSTKYLNGNLTYIVSAAKRVNEARNNTNFIFIWSAELHACTIHDRVCLFYFEPSRFIDQIWV